MLVKNRTNQLSWIYWGTIISSLGTFTFPGATMGILMQQDAPLWKIGFVMGLTRLGTLVGTFFLGDISDRVDAKKVVFTTEILAFLLSCLLILSWKMGDNGFSLFSLAVFFRFVVISVGAPGRNKMIKALTDEYNKNHFHSAVLLNAATYGPGVVGSLLGFFAIKFFSYNWVLIFDAATFILNGAIIYWLIDTNPIIQPNNLKIFQKFQIYFSHRKLFLFDILLTLPFVGTNVLMARISNGVGYRIPLLLSTFGLGAIIAPILLQNKTINKNHSIGHLTVLSSFLGLIAFQQNFLISSLFVALRNVGYWYLFSLYTGLLQTRENIKSIGSLFAARSFILTLLLGLGEFMFGIIGSSISLGTDLWIRASVMICLYLLSLKVQKI